MPPRPLKLLALAVLAALATGCPKPPPPAPPPEPAAEAPPSPPKCESLGEKCEAKSDTRAKIANSDLVFTPTPGWVYAQQATSTVAQTSDAGPGFAVLGIEVDLKDAKKEIASKDAAVAELVKQLGIGPLKRKVAWKKPDDHEAVGPLKIELWQLEEGARGAKKGPILIVAGTAGDGKGVVGVGFVPGDDKSGADETIMKSIRSLGKAQ
jgi:hypothetical protein